MHYPYPVLSEAIDSAKVVLSAITGATVERNELVHHGYVVEGFALSQIFPPNSPPVFGAGPAKACTKDECVDHLRDFVASQDGGVRAAGALPWLQIAMYVIDLIMKRLKP